MLYVGCLTRVVFPVPVQEGSGISNVSVAMTLVTLSVKPSELEFFAKMSDW